MLIFSFSLKKEASKLSKRCGPMIQAPPKEILGTAAFCLGYDTGDLEYITSLCIKTYMHTYIYVHVCTCVYVCVHTYPGRQCLFSPGVQFETHRN